MERIEKTIFLSYRRTNLPWALAIFQNLTQHGYDVFLDFQGIASGDFERVILENIAARAHFLVLLTPSALERCNQPGDWLRREIETALNTERNIIPLMLEGFDFGAPTIANHLTGMLTRLERYNGLTIPPAYFFEAMTRLRTKYLNLPLTAVLHPASISAQLAATRQAVAVAKLPVVGEDELAAQQWFERGFSATDVRERVRSYTEAIRLRPDYAEAFNNRGNEHCSTGDLENALQDYSQAIGLKPDHEIAFNNRANARRAKGDLQGALDDYTEAIRLNPQYADAFYNRAIACQLRGDIESALKDLTEAIRLRPDYAEAYLNRGNAWSSSGDLARALRDFSEAIRLKPNYAEAFNNPGLHAGLKEMLAERCWTTRRLSVLDPTMEQL